ncbi:MAG TPA: YebC/PmpR family DNA-binding transcriptional regulator [Gemmatimonadales bacterium]|nr:YebC/PmpR family DNA-binding transcriptional regulator [Gemmatimonadales bacterium]
MAGHSKWKQIKRKKAATDAKRGAAFTKLIKEITVAAKAGGGDPAGNARLRTAIDAAKAANMPAENIERAIKKGTGELEGVSYEEVTYEGYGPGGAAIFVEVTTDNANRTVAELRNIFSKNGGNLGTAGSVAWMFDRRGQIAIDATRYDEDTAMEAALEAGALDFQREGEQYIVITEVSDFHAVQEGLRARNIAWESAELALLPRSTVKVEGADAARLMKLMEALEEHDDVAKVFSNFDVDEEALAGV